MNTNQRIEQALADLINLVRSVESDEGEACGSMECDVDVTTATFDAIAGRPISIFEARQIALQILARAEQERSRFAEAEARRGIDWELDQ